MEEYTSDILTSFSYDTKEIDLNDLRIYGELDLSEFTKLNKLICSNNQITKITGLSESIESIDCSNNLLNEFTIHVYMTHFDYSKNPIKTLTVLENLLPPIPNSIMCLFFGDKFNLHVENLPFGLKYLSFSRDFNQPVDNLQGSDYKFHSISNLTFNYWSNFNHPIDNLPSTINELYLSFNFNQPLNNLPNSLIHLEFSQKSMFNQILDNLPNSLSKLVFNTDSVISFNQKLDNLPNSITHLTIGRGYKFPLDNLPSGLRYLQISSDYEIKVESLPPSIKRIRVFRAEQRKLFPEEYHKFF